MLVRTTLVALVLLLASAAAERSSTAADRPPAQVAGAAASPLHPAPLPTPAALPAQTDADRDASASRCLAVLPSSRRAPAEPAVAAHNPAGPHAGDPDPVGPIGGEASAADAVDPYPIAATAADQRAKATPAGDASASDPTPAPLVANLEAERPAAVTSIADETGAGTPPAATASDGTAAGASSVATPSSDRAGASAPSGAAAPVADGAGAGAPAAAPDADAAGSGASRDDPVPLQTSPATGQDAALPVRPDEAAMSAALERIVRAGDVPVPDAVLPATLIGQMLMVGFEGDDARDPGPRRLAAHIRAGRVGGVLFFKRNIKSAAAVRGLTALFQSAARDSADRLPVFVAVDQEGGLVQRLDRSVGFVATPSAAAIAARGEAAAALAYGRLADNLADWGFNLNLGPVVDLGFNDRNPVVTRLGRAFAPDPATVTRFAQIFVAAHRAAGVLTAIKHFPGHGSSNGDTHHGFVDVTQTFRPEEVLPFERLIAAGDAAMVMVAHVENGDIDPAPRPASLSPVVIEDVLRRGCGFAGVVISDDMEMAAIAELGDPLDVARQAILAGNDILVYGSGSAREGDLVAVLHARIRIAAQDPAVRARIGESWGRVVALKGTLRR